MCTDRIRCIVILCLLSCFSKSLGQNADFAINSTACIGESIDIINSSPGNMLYQWDFCANDLSVSPSIESSNTGVSIGTIYGIDIIFDGEEWIGLAADRSNNKLLRLNYGSSLNSNPSVDDLGNPGTLLSTPEGIDLIKVEGVWHAFIAYGTNGGSIIRIDFGNGLKNTPTSSVDIGSAGIPGRIRELRVVEEDGLFYIACAFYNGNSFELIDLGSDITSIPLSGDRTSTSITGASLPRGFELIKSEGDWYAFFANESNDEFQQLFIGDQITNTPTVQRTITGELTNAVRVSVAYSGGEYLAVVSNLNATPTLINLRDLDPANGYEALSNATMPNFIGIKVLKNDQKVYLEGLVFSTYYSIKYEDNCDVNVVGSESYNISNFYNSDGDYKIDLVVKDSADNISWDAASITINPNTAPSISYTTDNVCINSTLIFTPANSGLTSYSWDFDGDGMEDSDLENPEVKFDTLGGVGTYTVRVDVSDGTCDNFYEEEITIYEEPPAPSYTYSSSQTCVNADFNFTNTTSDGAYSGPLEYLWEFIDEPSGAVVATASTKDAIYAFETPGEKTVRLTSSIPGCEEITEQTLMITAGPTANFSATSVCQNESMQFTNASEDATSYMWDFGDEFTSSAENPSHIYTDAGNYFVTLTAFDAEGCEDTEVVEVAVADSPQISFDFEVPCTSEEGVSFTDLSTVTNADVVSWTWFVDGVEVSTQQNPVLNFNEAGIKNISLAVTSSNGCESTYNEDIEIFTAPSPDFSINIGCKGEATTFEDETIGSINSWLWTIDGVSYNSQDVSHVFADAGTYEVSLEVTGQNFCSESITKSVEVIELPTVSFSISGECDNELISAMDMSTSVSDPIISRRWMLDGNNVGNGAQLFLELADDSYELQLEVETVGGCMTSFTQTIEINDAPVSSFTSSKTYGIPEDELTFTNTSTGGVSYQWLLNGEATSTNAEKEDITFTESGTHTVSLVAQNSLGCNDTTTQEIFIAIPEVDLSIGSFELVNENNTGKVFLEVQNFSNLPVELTEAQITLEGQFSITEQILEFIDVGESSLVSLNLGIPITSNSGTSYLCVTLSSQYEGYDDIDPLNNEKCLTIQPQIKVENPFPNPVTDRFRMKVITPTDGQANLKLINSAGKIQMDRTYDANAGLNNFFVDMSTLDPGIYFISIEVLGTLHKRKVVKL